MQSKLEEIKIKALENIGKAKSLEDLDELRIKYLSKKGELSLIMQGLRDVPLDLKPLIGKVANEVKGAIENAFLLKKEQLNDAVLFEMLASDNLDINLPGIKFNHGTIHPLNQVVEDIEDLFLGLGYQIKEGPEVESDLYNFEMMNMDKDHPARAMQDSFYITNDLLLRTHTSPVQARSMLEAKGKPIKIICPGKTYRRDSDDATHSHQFMQIEGLVVDKNITFAVFKNTLLQLIRHLFGEEREIRLRPSYFPFTEPSVEVDVVYYNKDGKKGYIEVCGAGMVHPNVLSMGGYDPKKFSGFAFGIGVERIAILKYGIENIRNFYLNDLRFLKQFRGK
ncbi:phenylalanine--tRNA ligase subunit alpha [Acholeplasma sp. OttesenSCG-928-E16]|nr:phenylalanine--tRNA ligase subunit alpha [Acholeplasma sp. OttesenSCG-928-E16]